MGRNPASYEPASKVIPSSWGCFDLIRINMANDNCKNCGAPKQ